MERSTITDAIYGDKLRTVRKETWSEAVEYVLQLAQDEQMLATARKAIRVDGTVMFADRRNPSQDSRTSSRPSSRQRDGNQQWVKDGASRGRWGFDQERGRSRDRRDERPGGEVRSYPPREPSRDRDRRSYPPREPSRDRERRAYPPREPSRDRERRPYPPREPSRDRGWRDGSRTRDLSRGNGGQAVSQERANEEGIMERVESKVDEIREACRGTSKNRRDPLPSAEDKG